MAPINCVFKTMPTPDASQYTRFRKYRAVTNDFLSTGGLQPLGGMSTYQGIPLPTNSEALFLESANKLGKINLAENLASNKGSITLNNPVTNPLFARGKYDIYTFTPTQSGWYRIIVDQFEGGVDGPGGNDMDLVVGLGNTPLNIPAVIEYDFGENYDTPPATPVKVTSFTGGGSDQITSYFTARTTYQVMVIAFENNTPGTYTLTVRDNTLTMGNENSLTSTFYYTGSYQLYQFTAPQNNTYAFDLGFNTGQGGDDNRSDMFISQADTALDIQGCISYLTEEGPLPESVLEVEYGAGNKTSYPTLTAGSTYQVLIYQTITGYIFTTYDLIVNFD